MIGVYHRYAISCDEPNCYARIDAEEGQYLEELLTRATDKGWAFDDLYGAYCPSHKHIIDVRKETRNERKRNQIQRHF